MFLIACLQIASGQKPSVYSVRRMPFNKGTFSEISPVIYKDGILFCSDRRFSALTDRTGFDGRRLYNIYIASPKQDTSDWNSPVEIKSERSKHFNNGPLSVAPDGKTVYFSSEVETGRASGSKNFRNRIGIFKGEINGTDLQSLVPFKYNSTAYDVGQPSISKDGKYLFFASDMPGGQGRSDIYYCEWVNGDWSAPVNMGSKVNSAAVENYPYIHPSGKLYFSSDRPGGLGKLDVYVTVNDNGKWEDPMPLTEPINSPSDDFAYVAADNMQTGYFSTNRSGNNDDIYKFTSKIIRKASCDSLIENNYCYRFLEENAVKYDTIPFRYIWKFGDGTSEVGAMVDHCYSGPGKYIVQLDVENLVTKELSVNEKSDTLILKEAEQPFISAPEEAIAGQLIKLNADSTYLPGWKIVQYYWNFGDETIDSGKEVSKTFLKPGVYNVQLIVTTEAEPGGMVKEGCVFKNINIIRQP